MRDPVFVNPDLVLMGDAPGGVGLDSFSLDEEGRRRGGIVDLDVDLVTACGNQPFGGFAELQLAIEHEVVAALHIDADGFGLFQFIFATEFYSRPMAVLFPEGWEHCTAFGASVVEAIAEPDFKVGGVPKPGHGREWG